MLETEYADFSEQEKPEHWEEVPYGFRAVGPDRQIEAKWDGKAYRLTVYWTDDYTGLPRSVPAGIQPAQNPAAYLARQQAAFEANGWTFTLL